jgi:hypothetical protein
MSSGGINRVSQDKKPNWVGKQTMKDIFQKRKFEQLKEIGSIQKFLQIRRKK